MNSKATAKLVQLDYDKKAQRYILRILNKDIFPLEVVVANKVRRLLRFREEGRKGPSLFLNSK